MIKSNLCKCGCGELCESNYIRGHARRGRKNSQEHNIKISNSNKGIKRSEEVCLKMRERMLGRKHSEETKEKISLIAKEKGFGKWMKGKHPSQETIDKVSKLNKGQKRSEEVKEKFRQVKLGDKNPMYGKTHSEEYKQFLRNKFHNKPFGEQTKEGIEKMRQSQIGKRHSDETKRKMRVSMINHIIKENESIRPMNNIRACKFLDDLSKSKNWNLKHALNGGEFHIKKLGYFVDGYDEANNIVVEYDESLHYYKNGTLKEKDMIRQNEIIQLLNCRFFRFNERDNLFYEVYTELDKMEQSLKDKEKAK